MLGEVGQLVPYALLAALSPLGFAATVAVMKTGRLRMLGFAVGVVVGQLVACAALVLLGAASIGSHETSRPTFQALLELGLGVALLSYAVILHRRPAGPNRPADPNSRSNKFVERLGRVHTFTALAVGLLLGIGGPKRLVLTALASATIAVSGLTGSKEAALVGWYSALATILVWLPALAYLLVGQWVATRLDLSLQWLTRHQRPASIGALILVGSVLVAEAAASLL